MKKNFMLLILCQASLLFVLFSACKKDTEANNYLRGKIDGVHFESTSDIWATPGRSGDQNIYFKGHWSTDSHISFHLDGQGSNITTGSYNFQTGNLYNAGLYQDNWGYSAGYSCYLGLCNFSGSGKITILEISKKRIKGTFEFVSVNGAGDSKTVSDGEFYINR